MPVEGWYREMTIEQQLRELNAIQVQNQMVIGPAFATMRELVLKHGRPFDIQPLPNDKWQRDDGACYANALKAAQTRRYVYVEGYAVAEGRSELAKLHAWVTDPQNPTVAFDPTWGHGREYFGIPFRLEYVVGLHDALGHPGVIDAWELRWPLLSGEHRIEDVIWRRDPFKNVPVMTHKPQTGNFRCSCGVRLSCSPEQGALTVLINQTRGHNGKSGECPKCGCLHRIPNRVSEWTKTIVIGRSEFSIATNR